MRYVALPCYKGGGIQRRVLGVYTADSQAAAFQQAIDAHPKRSIITMVVLPVDEANTYLPPRRRVDP